MDSRCLKRNNSAQIVFSQCMNVIRTLLKLVQHTRLRTAPQLEGHDDAGYIAFFFFPWAHFYPFIAQSALRQVRSFSQGQFSTECDLVIPLSIPGTLPFPSGHPAAAYVFSLVCSSLKYRYLFFSNMS